MLPDSPHRGRKLRGRKLPEACKTSRLPRRVVDALVVFPADAAANAGTTQADLLLCILLMSATALVNRSSRQLRVLLLGGWSPGPLEALQTYQLEDGRALRFFEPAMHMPPAGLRWCCTWEAVLVGVCCWLALSALSDPRWPMQGRALLLLSSAIAVPASIVLLVRGSLRRSMATARRVISEQSVDVVVGFSWGGGVACWLLAERMWRGPTLLLAPTLAAMASAARLEPLAAPFFVARGAVPSDDEFAGDDDDHAGGDDLGTDAPLVHIVHAMHDGFCPPSQRRALQQTGAATHLCDAAHDLCDERTEAMIARAFAECLREATVNRRGSSAGHLNRWGGVK